MTQKTMSKESVTNDVRTIMKTPDGDERIRKIAQLLTDCSQLSVLSLETSKDPASTAVMNYAGMIAMMHLFAAGLPDDCSLENQLAFIQTVIGLVGANQLALEEVGNEAAIH